MIVMNTESSITEPPWDTPDIASMGYVSVHFDDQHTCMWVTLTVSYSSNDDGSKQLHP
jgi:hypothetical protein